jgi:FlaA1/EpsC-like NDP-sugar epimerase
MGSRGSVIPYFMSLEDVEKIPITDKRMTRFMITLEQGVDLVIKAFEDAIGGEIYVRKIPSMNIIDIAKSIRKNPEFEYIGIRPGEKIHEMMISEEDSDFTYEYSDYYKILPSIFENQELNKYIKEGTKVPKGFSYSSDQNNSWFTSDQLRAWIKDNQSIIGLI